MANGEAVVPSLMIPGAKIRVRDELSLWDGALWINDRGYDPEGGDFVYGNQRGVPYEMGRVTTFLRGDGDGEGGPPLFATERTVVNGDLKWTLGPRHRTEGLYRERVEAIGGPTAVMTGRKR